MKIKRYFIGLFLFLLLFGLSFPNISLAAESVTLSGSLTDSVGTAIPNATVTVNDANSDSATTDAVGAYSLLIPIGTYNVHVTPPVSSGFSEAIALNQAITADTVVNFVLTPADTITISGHIYGPLGNPPRIKHYPPSCPILE